MYMETVRIPLDTVTAPGHAVLVTALTPFLVRMLNLVSSMGGGMSADVSLE